MLQPIKHKIFFCGKTRRIQYGFTHTYLNPHTEGDTKIIKVNWFSFNGRWVSKATESAKSSLCHWKKKREKETQLGEASPTCFTLQYRRWHQSRGGDLFSADRQVGGGREAQWHLTLEDRGSGGKPNWSHDTRLPTRPYHCPHRPSPTRWPKLNLTSALGC